MADVESSSVIYMCPSFNRHSSNNTADIADRVVQELRSENGFGDDDVFSFSDDDNPADIGGVDNAKVHNRAEIVKQEVAPEVDERNDRDEREFEFPVSTDEVIFDNQISLRYPVFDRSLVSEVEINLGNGVDFPETDSKPKPAPKGPKTRPSLRTLLSEDREPASASTSSSEADDLDGIPPETYCIWKPKTEPRQKHKKSNSISTGNTSKRWKVRDLLKRSYSDDNYTNTNSNTNTTGKDSSSPVLLFIPPISPNLKTNNEKVNTIEKIGKVASAAGVGGGVASPTPAVTKPEKKIPAYKSKIGNIRLPAYLPYRDDQHAAFINFTGSSQNLYRY